MADITISKDETVELDTLIEESDIPLDPVSYNDTGTVLSDKFNTTGIQTGTAILSPKETGTHDININGQILTIKVEKQSTIPDSGVARYTFDDADTSGSTAIDIWNGKNGTINGATTGVSGANQTYTTNKAYDFDGSNDYVEIPDSEFKDFGTSNFTVSAWVNKDSSNGRIIAKRGGAGSYFELIDIGTDYRFLLDSGTQTDLKAGTPADNTWIHVVAIRDTNDIYLYQDGSQVGQISDSSGDITNTQPVTIGYRGDQYYFGGTIDDVRIYNKALSSSEVSNLYNSGLI